MPKNNWCSNKKMFASWTIKFPKMERDNIVDFVLSFCDEFLKLAEETQIFRIEQTSPPHTYNYAVDGNYIDFLRKIFDEKQVLAPFRTDSFISSETHNSTLTPSRVCVYNKSGEIEELDLYNVGKYLREVSDFDKQKYSRYLQPVAPLTLFSKMINFSDNVTQINDFYIRITTWTDIWFPEVQGFFWNQQGGELGASTDNYELAICHTPRLNQFLEEAHHLAMKNDCKWQLDIEAGHSFYRHMLMQTGIAL